MKQTDWTIILREFSVFILVGTGDYGSHIPRIRKVLEPHRCVYDVP